MVEPNEPVPPVTRTVLRPRRSRFTRPPRLGHCWALRSEQDPTCRAASGGGSGPEQGVRLGRGHGGALGELAERDRPPERTPPRDVRAQGETSSSHRRRPVRDAAACVARPTDRPRYSDGMAARRPPARRRAFITRTPMTRSQGPCRRTVRRMSTAAAGRAPGRGRTARTPGPRGAPERELAHERHGGEPSSPKFGSPGQAARCRAGVEQSRSSRGSCPSRGRELPTSVVCSRSAGPAEVRRAAAWATGSSVGTCTPASST